jgi:8-oxo-dGTP pyrophosphatase MutT (NUDIX family)
MPGSAPKLTRVDPEVLPPDPDFAARRGPAVAAARLTREALRACFAQSAAWQSEQESDGGLFRPEQPLRPAAVLIGLVDRPAGLQVLFTVRAGHLHDHAGQVSFPGGRVEAVDADPVAAALRETQEEIGLDPRHVEVLGRLPVYTTISGYEVTPVVGCIDAQAALQADPLEVEELFEVPLSFVMDGANHQRRLIEQPGVRRTVYAMEYNGRRRYLIWGATAAMLRNFYRFVLASLPLAAGTGAAPAQPEAAS